MRKGRRVLVYGGSFNPVHYGHLRVAAAAKRRLKMDQVLYIPCAASAYGKGLLPAGLRLRLLKLALRGKRGQKVSDLELRRGGVSRTAATLRSLRRRRPQDSYTLLLGLDQADKLGQWRQWRQVCALARVVWAPRPGAGPRARAQAKRSGTILKIPQYEISSSVVRARLNKGQSLSGLVPASVARVLTRALGNLTKLSTE